MNNVYSIADLVKVTGLTDRTIRNHITAGYLAGEKVNDKWQFTVDALENYFNHPVVKTAIMAKKTAMVSDFLLDKYKTRPEACVVLDIPGEEERAQMFLAEMNSGKYHEVYYSFDNLDGMPRVILKGKAEEVIRLAGKYLE